MSCYTDGKAHRHCTFMNRLNTEYNGEGQRMTKLNKNRVNCQVCFKCTPETRYLDIEFGLRKEMRDSYFTRLSLLHS